MLVLFNLIWKLERIVWKQQSSGIEMRWLETQLHCVSLFFACFSENSYTAECAERDFSLSDTLRLRLRAAYVLGKLSLCGFSTPRKLVSSGCGKNFTANGWTLLKALPGLVRTHASPVSTQVLKPSSLVAITEQGKAALSAVFTNIMLSKGAAHSSPLPSLLSSSLGNSVATSLPLLMAAQTARYDEVVWLLASLGLERWILMPSWNCRDGLWWGCIKLCLTSLFLFTVICTYTQHARIRRPCQWIRSVTHCIC